MRIVLVLLTILVAAKVNAQDTLFFKNGSSQVVKIEEISENKFRYKTTDNLNGPVYIVSKGQITSYTLANGQHVDLSRIIPDKIVHKNQIEFNAWQLQNKEIALSYQRFLGKKNNFSIRVPLSHGINYNHTNRRIISSGAGFHFWQPLTNSLSLSVGYDLEYGYHKGHVPIYTSNLYPYYSYTGYEVKYNHYLTHYCTLGLKFYASQHVGFNLALSMGIGDDLLSDRTFVSERMNFGFFIAF